MGRPVEGDRRRRIRGWLGLGVGLCLLAGAAPSAAQRGFFADDVELEDVLQVKVLDREVIAYPATRSGRIFLRLEIGESVLWTGTRGRVAVVLTDRRMLGAGPGSSAWSIRRYISGEVPQVSAQLGKRIALVVTTKRALGFSSTDSRWMDREIEVGERVLLTEAGVSTGVVVTSRRALGFSPDRGGFFDVDIQIRERIEDVEAGSGLATVTTSRRVLVFRGRTGSWEAQQRPIN
jgi:hypothetical protein